MDARVGTMFGRYRITGLLGKGGMGQVYEAYDTDRGRTVALKILADQFTSDERFRTRFRRESHAAAILQEPHVIPIHDWGEIDGSLYIDMRLVRGQTLYELVNKGPLEPARAVSIVNQIAAALDAAHAEGLIHRDVKPQNIIVTPADFAYLVDFGIAETKGETRLTMAGSHIGSFAYMAPERFTDSGVTPSVDVYALACVLYEALTGQIPFPADSQEQLILAHLSTPPPRPSVVSPSVPPSFDEVIARGMAKEPDDRYGSAGALGRAAQRALRADWRVSPQAETMLGPQPSYPQSAPPRPYVPPTPPPYPVIVAPQPESPRSGQWVLPTMIAVVAALLLGAIGIVIGLLANQNSSNSDSAATPTSRVPASTDYEVPSRDRTTSVSTPAAPPPLVKGPDQTDPPQTCDDGFSLTAHTGWGTHSGRGTADTSCVFANNVLIAYWEQYPSASRQLRTVSARGAVDCYTVAGARCDPANRANFLMECSAKGSDSWITCEGGKNAVVYLY
ncbi:MAG: serine/threonine-protein kinase [Candidatus Sericytochromatia bacterium]